MNVSEINYFQQKSEVENVICKMATILSLPQYVNKDTHGNSSSCHFPTSGVTEVTVMVKWRDSTRPPADKPSQVITPDDRCLHPGGQQSRHEMTATQS